MSPAATKTDLEALEVLRDTAPPVRPDDDLPTDMRQNDLTFFENYVLLNRASWDRLVTMALYPDVRRRW